MRVPMAGMLVAGFAIAASAVPAAQQPMVVPIVGSPAAQQPQPTNPAPANPNLPAAQAPPVTPPVTPAITTSPAGGPVMPPAMPGPASPAGVPAVRKLQLSFDKGSVNLVAQNVTVREILNEWQRLNGCQFVNADKLSGGAVSFEFGREPELHVIDALLRGAAGYIVLPRADTDQTGSVCGSVHILATSRPTSGPTTYTPSVSNPQAAPLLQQGMPDDEIPPVSPLMGPQQIQQRLAQPQPQPGPQPAQPSLSPFGPVPVGTTPGIGRVGGPAPAPVLPGMPSQPTVPGGPGRGGGGE